jgi:small GTP-binding protein
MEKEYKFKVVMLGDFAVGKTSLVRRFVYNIFSDKYLTTLGVKVVKKEIKLKLGKENMKVIFLIWDIAGRDGISDINENYLRGAKGAIIVGDITRIETIYSIKDYINLSPEIKSKYVVGINKTDLVDINEKKIEIDEILKNEVYNGHNPATFYTSAKDGSFVNEMFYQLAQIVTIKEIEGKR